MEIKKGYKMTDVGVIPEDWEVKSIGELFSSLRSASITKEMFVEKGCMCVHYGDIHTKYGRILDCDKDVIPNVPISLCKNYPNVEDGDIIMADASEDIEGVGKCVSVINTKGRDIISGLHTILLRDRNNSFYNSFPTYMFSCENVKKGIESYAVGTKVNSISYNSIKECQFCYPSKKEQQAIANALTKVDNLIMSLSKVIEKKKLIKKGAMQKLLSGEMRLDGYNNIINSVNLSDIGEIKAGGTPSTNVPSYWGGTINWLQSGAVKNRVLDIRDVEKTITYDGLANSSAYLIKENSVLIAITGATCGNIAYLPFKSAANQSVVAIQVNAGFNSKYIFYMLIQNSDKIVNNRGGSAQGGVAVNILKEIELCIHEDIDEQTAIVNILTTMDNEIEALEKERDKYKCIKQGMMQQLLTGKIRLTCQ